MNFRAQCECVFDKLGSVEERERAGVAATHVANVFVTLHASAPYEAPIGIAE